MSAAKKLTTVLSTKGQVVLPKVLRDQQGWEAGVELVVENRPEGLLLKREAPVFEPTKLDDVFGMLKYDGPPVSVDDMKRAVQEAAAERYARSFDRDD